MTEQNPERKPNIEIAEVKTRTYLERIVFDGDIDTGSTPEERLKIYLLKN